MKNIRILVTTLLSTLLLAGCATIMSGSTQNISIQAIDATSHEQLSGVSCSVSDGQGNIYPVPSLPGNFTVSKGKGALTPSCNKKGYRQTSVGVGQSFNAWTVVNVIFWPGLVVDALTGAVQQYPSHITVLMKKA